MLSRRISTYLIFAISTCGLPLACVAAPALTFNGNTLRPIEVKPERTTGLDNIYVLYDLSGVSMSVAVSDPAAAKIYKFSNLGGAYSEEIKSTHIEDGKIVLDKVEANLGYIVEDGTQSYYYWVVEYKEYRLKLESIHASSESDCDYTRLDVEGSGEPIQYFTINGQPRVLDRELRLKYDTQRWDEQSTTFVTEEAEQIYESLTSPLLVSPPAYCATVFHLSGDRFLRAWDWETNVESSTIEPIAVDSRSFAHQAGLDEGEGGSGGEAGPSGDGEEGDEPSKDASNQIRGEVSGLGGSAPADISFTAEATQGVIHHEWQMSKTPDFEVVDYRFNEQNVDYTFDQEGTFYMRYIGSNADGSCESIGDTFTIAIGASELLCPNAFTPNGDGINDKWKVAFGWRDSSAGPSIATVISSIISTIPMRDGTACEATNRCVRGCTIM